MSVTKYNHELQVNNGVRILDPIGKLSFNPPKNAIEEQADLHIIDISKSSNHFVNILEDYANNTNWVQFFNLSDIHRFDLNLRVRNPDHDSGNIYFGNGTNRYEEPQNNIGSLSPKIFWIHGNPNELLKNIKTNLFRRSSESGNKTSLFKTNNNLTVILRITQADGSPIIQDNTQTDEGDFGFAGSFGVWDKFETTEIINQPTTIRPETEISYIYTTDLPLDEYLLNMQTSVVEYKDIGLSMFEWVIEPSVRYWRFIDNEYGDLNFTFRYGNLPGIGEHLIGYLSSPNYIPKLLPNNEIIIEIEHRISKILPRE